MNANDIRKGMIVIHNNEPHTVMDFQHRTPGNLRAFVQVKLRNLKNGNSFEVRYSSTENVERAMLQCHDMEFLYSDDTLFHFMNSENYEQVAINEEQLGDSAKYMTEGMSVKIDFYEGQAIAVELPPSIELEVLETEPEVKGGTASNSPKPAKLSNGVVIMVPPFIKQGEMVRINPREDKYLERAK
ncbi:elongation factor P [candidate division BRC1 bacterium HGW-BRC1-1]|jgi:elongation factor P|nr:MAG: elongation factor P [candidate division BRC1 bacterium HGW-BRC1-1]